MSKRFAIVERDRGRAREREREIYEGEDLEDVVDFLEAKTGREAELDLSIPEVRL